MLHALVHRTVVPLTRKCKWECACSFGTLEGCRDAKLRGDPYFKGHNVKMTILLCTVYTCVYVYIYIPVLYHYAFPMQGVHLQVLLIKYVTLLFTGVIVLVPSIVCRDALCT